MLQLRKLLVFCLAIQLFLITPPPLHAASCLNNWSRPSLQTMETEMIYAALTEYATGERYFFMKQGTKAFDVYYLRSALLIKGLAESDIDYDNIFWLPMVFVMPASILTKAFPQGPCSITQNTPISLPEAEGEIIPISHGVISYHYQARNKNSAGYFRGTMQFTPPAAAPSEDADLKSYKLVGRTKPYPVLGGKDMPVTTIAGLRRVMAAKAVTAKQDSRNQAMKERALDAAGSIAGHLGDSRLSTMPEFDRNSVPDAMRPEDIVMAPKESATSKDSNELYPLQIGNRWGYVNKAGYVVVEPRFNLAFFFEDRLARVRINNKCCVIDKMGRFIIEPQYDDIGRFRDGLACVRQNGKIGFINEAGKVIVAIEGDGGTLSAYQNGVASFRINDKSIYVDKNGRFITRDQFWQASQYTHRNNPYPVQRDGKWGLAYSRDNLILSPQYDQINDEKDGLFLVRKGGRYGFIDKSGTLVIGLHFEHAFDFKGGLAGVKKNGEYGFIDKTGRFVIEPKFDSVRSFDDGIAVVMIDQKWGLIDVTGRYVAEPQFKVDASREQPANFDYGIGRIKKNGKWGLMDRAGKILAEPQFDVCPSFFNGLGPSDFAVVSRDFKKGVVHKSGKIIIQPQYTDITEYPNFAHPYAPNMFQVSKYPFKGCADNTGNIFVMTDKVCNQYVVKNRKGEITCPRNIKEICEK